MDCQKCGQQNDENAIVCSNCGQPLQEADLSPIPPASPAPSFSVPPVPPVAPVQPAGPAGASYAGQPQPSYPLPGAVYPPQGSGQALPPMPPTYLWQSIVVLLLCCWPLAIPAVVFATQVGSKYRSGDYAGAMESSGKARSWTIAAFVVGIVAMVAFTVFVLPSMLASYDYSTY